MHAWARKSRNTKQLQEITSDKLDAATTGVYLITVTPFTDSGELDLASTDRMVDFCLDCGVTGLTILGIMGEATKRTAEESRLFVGQVLARVAGRVDEVWRTLGL